MKDNDKYKGIYFKDSSCVDDKDERSGNNDSSYYVDLDGTWIL